MFHHQGNEDPSRLPSPSHKHYKVHVSVGCHCNVKDASKDSFTAN